MQTVASGFGYLEALRWYDGHLWFSDLGQKKVWKMAPDGAVEIVASVPSTPVDLGFRPDGSLLIVSSDDRQLLLLGSNGVETAADLTSVAVFAANDLAVDAEGRCYISHFGYDLFGGETPNRLVWSLSSPTERLS